MQELAAAAPSWPQLGHLDLTCEASSFSFAVKAAAHHWRQLTTLQLVFAEGNPSLWDTLAANASAWPLLQQLTLHANQGIGPEGCQMLAAAAPAWPKLQQLSITFGQGPYIGSRPLDGPLAVEYPKDDGRGMEALTAAAVHWPEMQRFELRSMDMYSNWGLQWLAESVAACWPGLTR
jgi:hypothetical protein